MVSPDARIEENVTIGAPCFIDAGAVVKRGATVGPYSFIGHHCHIGENATVDGAILWPNTWVDADARVGAVLAGRNCHFGRSVEVSDAGLFGDKSVVTDYSQT
jgi:NDP-sugar pyrophosphorylase family protein